MRTAVGNVCGRDFAEALIGHGFYMDTCYVLSDAQKQELYLKAEPNRIDFVLCQFRVRLGLASNQNHFGVIHFKSSLLI